MNQSQLTCGTCPGSDRCPIAEAEDCLSELSKAKIQKELSEIQWMISLHATEGDVLEASDLRQMLILRTKLLRILHDDSPAEVFSAAREIARARLLQNGLQ